MPMPRKLTEEERRTAHEEYAALKQEFDQVSLSAFIVAVNKI